MEASGQGTDAGGSSAGKGASPLARLSGLGERIRAMADEKIGPEAGERLKATGDKLKAAGGESLPSGATDRLRGVGGPAGGNPAGATVPAPPFEERPELYVGAAFAGGLVLAGVMRLIAR